MLPSLPPSLQAEVDVGVTNLENTLIPAFVNLYRHLKKNILDHDASTLAKKEEYLASGVDEQLRKFQTQITIDAILLRALREICLLETTRGSLSAESLELCYIISVYLSSTQQGLITANNDTRELMAEELSEFRSNIPTIATELSSHIAHTESTIAKMLEALTVSTTDSTQPATTKSRIPSTLPSTSRAYRPASNTSSITLLQHHQRTQPNLQNTTLPTLLTNLSTTLHTLLTAQSTLLTNQIRHAELHTHSTVARHLTSHATFLATVAQGLSLKSQIFALQREKEAYAAEGIREALRAKFERLTAQERGLEERENRLRRLLGEFETAGGMQVFERLGRGYRDVEDEIESVRTDVERLEAELQRKRGVGKAWN